MCPKSILNFLKSEKVQIPVPIFGASDLLFKDSDDEYILNRRYLGNARLYRTLYWPAR